jgi:hypothetical protein
MVTKDNRGRKKKLSESIEELGISAKQYLFDKQVIGNLYDMSESVEDFRSSKNLYFIEQRNAALESGHIDAAEYYDNRMK